MIINRRTFVVKRGCFEQLAEMLKKEAKRINLQNIYRIYEPDVAPFDILAFEMEFENWDQYHKHWEEWTPPEGFWEKWFSLTESGGTNEIWRLFE